MLDAYATHIPVLAAVLATAGPGPVLELGAGMSSTPMLHAICAATGRGLLTLEGDPGWLARFAHYRSSAHALGLGWGHAIESERWAVVFVDHAPAARRIIEIDRLRETCELMVVHDTEDAVYDYEPAFAEFRYRVDYKRMTPWTSILSMTNDLSRFRDL